MVNGAYTEKEKAEIGEKLAQLFCLKIVRRKPSLYKTSWGNKYDRGVFEMVSKISGHIKDGSILDRL